ncbi:SH3 domain-containing protein [Hydrogenimonas sp.]
MRRLLFPALLLFWFAGCAPKEPPKPDLTERVSPFLRELPAPFKARSHSRLYADFLSRRYAPWQMSELNVTREAATWAVRHYASKPLFAENRRPLPKARFEAWVRNADYDAFNTLRRHAVTLRSASLRLFPTMRPIFYDPSLPGEGYPFDYNQNSAVKPFTPLIVSHLSRDGGWAFVQTPFALGWLPVGDIAYLSGEQIDRIVKMGNMVVLKEATPVYDGSQRFLFYAKMATILPLVGEEEGFYRILVPKKIGERVRLEESLFPRIWGERMPLTMDAANVGRVADELLGEPYGWGGLVQNRDCSAMTRDFFAPFGIWLPRNSAEQAKVGRVLSLAGLDAAAKERRVVEEGVPFRTLIHLPGHIMLYVGSRRGRAYVMHNLWGIRTKEGGRYIVGRAVVTSLRLGEELPDADPEGVLIKRIDSMNIVVPPAP